jgi:hypothetical protein
MISVERLEKLSNELSFEAATIERVVRLGTCSTGSPRTGRSAIFSL